MAFCATCALVLAVIVACARRGPMGFEPAVRASLMPLPLRRRAAAAPARYAGRPFGRRRPADVSRRTSSLLPISTAPAPTASAYRWEGTS